jgi:Kef-type K+ transport system membrane component KefB/nucleotide-binding universal stress UspA family protein
LTGLSELQILHFILQVGALLLASRLLGDLMKRWGQAAVVGELLAGVVLGPSILGHLAPPLYAWLFPSDPLSGSLLEAVAWLGVITLLLYIGLETDLGILHGMGRTATVVSVFGMTIPFGCGLALGFLLPASSLAAPNERLIFALFMAVAIAISAVPVIARILLDLGLMRRDLGMLILAAGIIDDTTGWLMLSIVAGLAEQGSVHLDSFLILLLESAVFILFCYFVGRRMVTRVLRWVDDRTYVEHAKFSAMLVIALICAFITQSIGIHAVFGAYIAGVMMAESARVRKYDRSDLEAAGLGFLAPIFFAYSGLKTDLSTLRDPVVLGVVLAVAIGSKFVGCGIGALAGRLKWRESLAVAIGMNARGGMGILVGLIGLSLGVLTPQMYTVIIAVAVITSVMTPPLLSWAISSTAWRPSDAERAERDRLMSRLHFTGKGAKVLVLSGGGPNADLAAHVAAALARTDQASITIFRAVAPDAPSGSRQFDEQFSRMKRIAEVAGARNVQQRTGIGDSVVEAIVAESERGYDAIFAGASHLHGYDDLGGEVLRGLVSAARAPIVIVRNGRGAVPFRHLLVPITGAAFSRLGANLAMHYGREFKARVTALYVHEGSPYGLPLLGTGASDLRREGTEFVEEISRLGREVGATVETRVDSGRRPENVILSVGEREKADLLVMGVLFRSSDERLFFGPKVREILRKAKCAVALIVPPQLSERHQ